MTDQGHPADPGDPATAAGPGDPALAGGVLDALERLVVGLRRRGIAVGLSERIDATASLSHVDLGHRDEVRAALSSTLVKHAHQRQAFGEVFDRCFPVRPSRALSARVSGHAGEAPEELGGSAAPPAGRTLLEELVESGVEDDLRLLAERIVAEHGGFDEGARTERYHVYRIMRAVDLAMLLRAAMARAREHGEQPDRAELEARIEVLRRLITEQVRAELADSVEGGDTGTQAAVADPFDVEIARATASELAAVREAVRPLARQLAARLRRRRQSMRSGRVDMRGTVRRSLQSGGVPLDVSYRRPKVHRPELFVLCDVSGSVSDFAGFTLTLISALSDELSRTRSFAFVDAVDEITGVVQDSPTAVEPWQLLQHGKVIGADGHSDYGTVFGAFWDSYCRAGMTDRSTLIITGDARNNYRPHRAEALRRIAARARAVYWLNPEPRSQWNATDSVMATYGSYCDGVFEVRTLRQLGDAVQHIL